MFAIDTIPHELHAATELALEKFTDALQRSNLEFPNNQQAIESLPKIFCCSEFIALQSERQPQLLIELINSGDLFSADVRSNYVTQLSSISFDGDAALMKVLRQFRNQQMMRIAWRDLAEWSDLNETLADLTALAECCIQFTLNYLYQQACERKGTPVLEDGSAQNIVILGMGKLGAWELNYSSDIDLIFAYQQDGVLADRKETTYGEFFTRICRQLVKILDETTADGFVFRTDIRLRPFGDSGPILMTFDGLENYYQTQAREWERYAMVKVRPVAGDKQGAEQFMSLIKPFVYRRYLDYGAFEELRSLKQQITQELQRKDRMDNVKLGPGGIREIEFIGQAFQLIRGGQDTDLQERQIQIILKLLGDKGLLSAEDSVQLIRSYQFLRRAENHIQEYQDRQAHDLPKTEKEQLILAFSMGFSDWQSFKQALDKVRTQVHAVFTEVFSIEDKEAQPSTSSQIWMGQAHEEIRLNQLAELSYRKPEEILTLIDQFQNASSIKRLTIKGANALNKLMPKILELAPKEKNPQQTLQRLCRLFEALAGRNVYLALLAENEGGLHQLIKLSSASPWISDYLSQFPSLFDELLDTRSLYEPLEKSALKIQLESALTEIEPDDIEQIMFALRKFKQINVLRVAAADIMGAAPLMVVSDYLSYIAEVILEKATEVAWQILEKKHGVPPNTSYANSYFGVLGFGKLGGIELSYSSDLDLIFICNYPDNNALTDGRKQITSMQFYANLGQRIRNLLNTQMLSGIAYEIDMRLRPRGEAGLLVTPLNSYQDYLDNEAWTWEHQALVRARFINGDINTQNEYESIRKKTLGKPRNNAELKKEVREMRIKMRKNLDKSTAELFSLKQGIGGITDIEFMVQYLVLSFGNQHPELSDFTDNMRLLGQLTTLKLLTPEQACSLESAYCTFRDRGHKEALQDNKAMIPQEELIEARQKVAQIWQTLMTS
ncbi:MAG: bifunctional [glutamate--ammonia ligase]-adenylyl-L-tyrosine phosphorylase/[glutamate--ammonia-ligase] adenylyltransferase [Methyloprofundus sp.]|nr:bifunctional [glutamate--ammonia ligase]-adenylyl-L-tyrosine phosphorylase/[glutamate--ammonia-ligase] adenylyltransferase [Methyloprofundus sp.]